LSNDAKNITQSTIHCRI